MYDLQLSEHEFQQFQGLMHEVAGISLSAAKLPLVGGRLAKRVRQLGMNSYREYFSVVMCERDEMQIVVDLLTTNETHFFREPRHFDMLRNRLLPALPDRGTLRIWSGACSSGEEPYSIAMVLADCLRNRAWEVVASDISSRVLDKARAGLYSAEVAKSIPRALLSRYCLKGVGSQDGVLMIDPELKRNMRFKQVNLNAPLPELGKFDIIFLRNVMIYFNMEAKRQVLQRMLPLLRPGGYFIVSHAETLNGVTEALDLIVPSVYVKRAA